MQIAQFHIELTWKEFNVSLPAVEAWMKANAGEQYCGNCASGEKLQLWFLEEPSEEIKVAIDSYWSALTDESSEATAYKTQATLNEEKETAKAAGKAKLLALGLSESEVSALVG